MNWFFRTFPLRRQWLDLPLRWKVIVHLVSMAAIVAAAAQAPADGAAAADRSARDPAEMADELKRLVEGSKAGAQDEEAEG